MGFPFHWVRTHDHMANKPLYQGRPESRTGEAPVGTYPPVTLVTKTGLSRQA
jgi:hypothetical protein